MASIGAALTGASDAFSFLHSALATIAKLPASRSCEVPVAAMRTKRPLASLEPANIAPLKGRVIVNTNPTELDRRHTGGMQVALLWDRPTGELTVTVNQLGRRETLQLPVAPNDALRAFWHPYAYAAALGLA